MASEEALPLIVSEEHNITINPLLPSLNIRVILMYPSTSIMIAIAHTTKPSFGSFSLSMPVVNAKSKTNVVSTKLRSITVNDISQDVANLLAKRFARQCYVAMSLDMEWTEELLKDLLSTCIQLIERHLESK